MIPFSMVCFETLNHIVETCMSTNHDDLEKKGNMFGVWTFFEESSWALVIGELSLFKRLSIPSSTFKDLLWWRNHEGQFPNVAFLANCFFGIPRSHIETTKVFNLVGYDNFKRMPLTSGKFGIRSSQLSKIGLTIHEWIICQIKTWKTT